MPTLIVNRRLQIEFQGRTRLAELDLGPEITFGCKSGKCGICAVRITGGAENVLPRNHREQRLLELLNEPNPLVRLACQCTIFGSAELESVE